MKTQEKNRVLALLRVGIILTFGLASCVGTHLNKGLAALNGKPIETAFEVLGYPSRKMEIGENTVYYWSQSHVGMLAMPATAQSSGLVGVTPVAATTTYTSYVPTNLYGEIQIKADSAGIIKGHSYHGNNGGLAGYAASLGRYARKIEKQDSESRLRSNQ